jgi:serine/threonine-protein kinase HipA
VADRLAVWLYDTPVAVLTPGPEFRIHLEWRPEGIERWGLGSPALELTDSGGGPMRADTHLGQRVGGQADIRKVTADSLIDEAASWGIRRKAAPAVVTDMLDRVLTAIPATPGDERVLAVIREQAERIRRG